MIPSLTIIDGLVPDYNAEIIRNRVLELGFQDIPFMGGLYQGTNMDFAPAAIPQAIADFFGRQIKLKVQAFRSGHEGTKLHVNIHADNPISQWACVYYLNLPEDCKGGTAFYQMKKTRWHDMPTEEEMGNKGVDLEWVKSQWTNPGAWDLTDIASMRFNRMIIYPTHRFHSRWPLEGWGSEKEPEHARLVWVGFFDFMP